MRTIIMSCAVAGAFGALLTAAPPASAQLAQPQTAIGIAAGNDLTTQDLTTQVQWRRGGGWRGGGWRGGGWRGGYGWRGGGWRGGGWRGYGYRPWIGPGIGFATGLAIGGAFAAPYYYPPRAYYGSRVVDDAVAYCIRRFKSYDVESGTYLGFDGRRHACP
jgi:hypothetical protein